MPDASVGSVLCPLRVAADAAPETPAIVGPGGAITYAELELRVSAMAGRVRELAFEPGERVALYMAGDEWYVVLLLALLRAGVVACPLSNRLPPRGLPPQLEKIRCRALISDEKFLDNLPLEIRRLRPEVLEGLPEGSGVSPRSEPPRLRLDLPATLIFTSGSTGGPKAALHTFGNHYFSALGSNTNIALAPGDRWLLSLPLYHVGGLSILFRCLLAGATITLPEPGLPLSRSIPAAGATHVSLVATQLRRLLEKKQELPGLKAVLLGGGPTPESLLDEATARGLPVHTSYGLTEMASQVTTTPPGASGEKLRTSGSVLPYREVSVSPDGEILVRGETLFAGYVSGNDEDRPLDEDGWFHTGDLGELDADSYLSVRGRKDNLFISGGENIQPEEIEEALCRLENVTRAVVVSVPDEEFGECPVAFVLTAKKTALEGLGERLGETLPRFKVPVAFYGWPEDADPARMKVDRASFRGRALRLYHNAQD